METPTPSTPERSQVTELDALPVTAYPHALDAGRDPGRDTGAERVFLIGGIFPKKYPDLLAVVTERISVYPIPVLTASKQAPRTDARPERGRRTAPSRDNVALSEKKEGRRTAPRPLSIYKVFAAVKRASFA